MTDIIERYCALLRYNIEIPSSEMDAAMTIQTRWKQLHSDSKEKDISLFSTKNQFRTVTANQDREFRMTLLEVRRDFLGMFLSLGFMLLFLRFIVTAHYL